MLLTQSYTGQDGLAVSNVTATEYSRAYISWSGRAPCRPTGVTISKRCGRGPGANCLDRFLIISMAGPRTSWRCAAPRLHSMNMSCCRAPLLTYRTSTVKPRYLGEGYHFHSCWRLRDRKSELQSLMRISYAVF